MPPSRFVIANTVIGLFTFVALSAITWLYWQDFIKNSIMYLPVSVSLAAGSITYAGIVVSLYLREESKRLMLKKLFLQNCLSRLESWTMKEVRSKPILKGIYERTRKRWSSELRNIHLLNSLDIALAFTPFISFVVSVLVVLLFSYSGSAYHVMFAIFLYLGLALFFVQFVSLVWTFRTTQPYFGVGQLWVRRIDGTEYERLSIIAHNPAPGREIKLEVCFEGKIRNGFFHAVLVGDHHGKNVPDKATYFGDYYYDLDNLRIHVDPEYDTGVLQGEFFFEDTCVEMNFSQELEPVGKEKVRYIIVGVYEDPIDLPSSEPRRARFSPTDPLRQRHCIQQVNIELRFSTSTASN